MPCAVLPAESGLNQPSPRNLQLTNLTYWAAKGLTFDPVRLCSDRTVRLKLSTFPPRATFSRCTVIRRGYAPEGHRFEVLCLFPSLAYPTKFSALSKRPATPTPPPSRNRRSRTCWRDATCSASRRPVPARR